MTNDEKAPVGVLAPTKEQARHLASILGLSNPMVISPHSLTATCGRRLSALLVDDSLWPLDRQTEDALLPCLIQGGEYIVHAMRVDSYAESRL